jgi:hypothetical protein
VDALLRLAVARHQQVRARPGASYA